MLPFKVRPESGRPFEPVDSWAPVPALALQAPDKAHSQLLHPDVRLQVDWTAACAEVSRGTSWAHAFVPAGPMGHGLWAFAFVAPWPSGTSALPLASFALE